MHDNNDTNTNSRHTINTNNDNNHNSHITKTTIIHRATDARGASRMSLSACRTSQVKIFARNTRKAATTIALRIGST